MIYILIKYWELDVISQVSLCVGQLWICVKHEGKITDNFKQL